MTWKRTTLPRPGWALARHGSLLLLVYFLVWLAVPSDAYLIIATEDDPPGHILFNTTLPRLGSDRHYKINPHRTANFVHRILSVDPHTGVVRLKHYLDCTGVYYPNLFTVYVDSLAERNHGVDYYSSPLRIFVSGRRCESDPLVSVNLADEAEEADVALSRVHIKVSEAKRWISETFASYAIPSGDDWTKICLRQSQYVCSLKSFLPKSVMQNCDVHYVDVSDPRFEIETHAGDLVAADNICIHEPIWKVTIHLEFVCNTSLSSQSWPRPAFGSGLISATEHRLKIVFHHRDFNDTDLAHRVRRELRNQSPYFEETLYMASILEEKPPGLEVTTVKARDPENSPVQYSMVSLLDARSQTMFGIDSRTGVITTLSRLDRESMDVHYFRVTAVDDSFPPRSGTTTLQINVIDANDHPPVFESSSYLSSVRESVPVGSTVVTLKATDQDVDKNGEVEYTIESELPEGGETVPGGTFRIDPKTGILSTRVLLDRETVKQYTLVVVATDQAPSLPDRQSSTATVVVNVIDENDNYPQFTERAYSVNVLENITCNNEPIASVSATDADEGANAVIRYSIIGGNTQSQFVIQPTTGEVMLVKCLDYEVAHSYKLGIRALDGGAPSKSNTTQLLVNVLDVNDNTPRFYTSLFQETVIENVHVGYSLVRVQAYDADEGENGAINYSIATSDMDGNSTNDFPFAVDRLSGWITTTKELDREEQSRYEFTIVAADRGVPSRNSTATVVLTIQDVNDNDPVFNPKEYNVVISEDRPPGTIITRVTATDRDENPRLHYEITDGNLRGRFSITTQNGQGVITIAQPLDYKQEKSFVLIVTAQDSGAKKDVATVNVNVSDANNFAPAFDRAPYTAKVFEDEPVGTTVLVVSATDGDVGQNAMITYSLNGNVVEEKATFTINPQTGAIVTAVALDRETISSYTLTVTAKDRGMPPLSDQTEVEITVADVNDNPPVFRNDAYYGSISEDALVGTSVVQISADDADTGLNGRIRYALAENPSGNHTGADGSFVVDPTSGVIRTNRMLDRESVAKYQLEALAIDRGSPALSSSVIVYINVEDVNDNPPSFESDKLVMYIAENSPIGSTVGQIYAHDPDEGQNAVVKYLLIDGDDSNNFQLVTHPGTGGADLITRVALDYESSRKKFDLGIRASSNPLRTDVHVQVMVTDVNDNPPLLKDFQIVFNNFRDCFPSGPIGHVPAFDADVTDELRYRILSGNNANLVHLNETTGQITLSPLLNTNVPKLATMEVVVSDGANEAKAVMTLIVRLITEEMLFKSVTVRLDDMTEEAFLSPLMSFFVEGLAAIIPCPRENIFLFSVQDDTDVNSKILNVSFSARRADVNGEEFYSPQFLQERVYLNRAILARLSTVQILPFDDNLCVREPCPSFEECLTVLKFGNASGFISSDTVLFRPIYPVTTYACHCPNGFTGKNERNFCDTEVNLCYSNPCANGGTCTRREGGYTCICRPGYTGRNCDTDISNSTCSAGLCRGSSACSSLPKGGFKCEKCGGGRGVASEFFNDLCELRARSFARSSFLTLPSLKRRHRFQISLKFATQMDDGLLLYNGRYNEQHDFIALEIISGTVQFSFSLGAQTATTVVIAPNVNDGNWHKVIVDYFNKTVTLSVDDCDTNLAIKNGKNLGVPWNCANRSELILDERCSSVRENCHRFLDLTGPLQVGGLPALPATDFQVNTKDFIGCISDLYIDNVLIDLNRFVADNGTAAGCPEKRSFCASNPCKNGGLCKEGWGTYQCECPDRWGSKNCSQQINLPWRFRGDGMLAFSPLLKPIVLPWYKSMTIRTLQSDGFLMSVQIGQNSSGVLMLRSGAVVYLYNGETVVSSPIPVNDGEWHRIEIRWTPSEVWIDLDYGQRQVAGPLPVKVQGLIAGLVLIGGFDSATLNIATEHSYFEGCIKDVQLGSPNNNTKLQTPTNRMNVADGCASNDQCDGSSARTKCPYEFSVCVNGWERTSCECRKGFVGDVCSPTCESRPCENNAKCIADVNAPHGYICKCNSTEYSGEYCENRVDQPCPSGWWGYPVCGPCHCPDGKGYNPNCNKTTGECYCKENHYQPPGSDKCFPCGCYSTGSFSSQCNPVTGQCHCRPGVIGRTCDACPNGYAEVTSRGCEVVYDACPRSFSGGLWWERSKFGQTAILSCPEHSLGKASRVCDDALGGWQDPDLFNCTSKTFFNLRRTLSNMEKSELSVNTFVAVKVADDLWKAANDTSHLQGADVLIAEELTQRLLDYEVNQTGLNLTHSQDKDYIFKLVQSASRVLSLENLQHWARIENLTGKTAEQVVLSFDKYIGTLTKSQVDTYTNPFEIVAPNIVLGLDMVTAESIYGYESQMLSKDGPGRNKEQIIIPDTSQFLQPAILPVTLLGVGNGLGTGKHSGSPVVVFPKYNNYMQDPSKFDPNSQILVPLSLLGIRPIQHGETTTRQTLAGGGQAVVSYVQYRTAGQLLPARYDDSVLRRWGVEVRVGSPVVSMAAFVPTTDITKKLTTYQQLTGPLSSPVRLRLWLNPDLQSFGPRVNPQCVYWSTDNGEGQWSRAGCQTEMNPQYDTSQPLLVNCTCSHLSTFTVLVDIIDMQYIPEPSETESIVSYVGFCLSLPMLFVTLLILTLLRGVQTNSNSIHKNLVFCVFLAELLYFTALKARRSLAVHEFSCKMTAIGLHYVWLSAFTWTFVDAVHLYRMLTEMRDINHGPMRFYYTVGYGLPAVIVGLAVGVRADQYGNFYFCWLSIYESVVWSLIGPVCVAVFITLIVLLMSVRAAFTLKDHILAFGNLRTLLWLSVVALPLLGVTWVLAVLTIGEQSPTLTYSLSAAVVVQGLFSLVGYCVVNTRVRKNLHLTILRCMGRKVPLVEENTQTPVATQPRSSLAYRNSARLESIRRNIGISTSSTTSRSTTKTGSSPYRSDGHLRNTNTSTSTSNYNSGSELPSYLRAYDLPGTKAGRSREPGESRGEKRPGNESDSDSELSADGRSLELASSHSSDDDESSQHHSTHRSNRVPRNLGVSAHSTTSAESTQGSNMAAQTSAYLPNIYPIAEGDGSPGGSGVDSPNPSTGGSLAVSPSDLVQPPPTLNIVSKAQLFPNLKPMYAPRWSSQLPEAYITANVLDSMSLHNNQWSPSGLTNLSALGSHTNGLHEVDHYKKSSASPSPLPHPNKMVASSENFHDMAETGSETDDKMHMGDKYLFPYTAEEDHCGSMGLPLGPSIGMINGSPSPLHHPGTLTSCNISDSEKDMDMSETPV